jgi:hypothetical protein
VDQQPKSGRTLKRLRHAGENPMVTMLADHYSEDWETLWWVRADGRATILAAPRQTAKPRPTAGPLRWPANRHRQHRQTPPTGPVLAVTAGRRTGRAGSG